MSDRQAAARAKVMQAGDQRLEEIDALLGYGWGWAEILKALDISADSLSKFLKGRDRLDLVASLSDERAAWARRRQEAAGFSDLRLTTT